MALLDQVKLGRKRTTLGAGLNERIQKIGEVELGMMGADATLGANVAHQ